jgi:hypothetical protein
MARNYEMSGKMGYVRVLISLWHLLFPIFFISNSIFTFSVFSMFWFYDSPVFLGSSHWSAFKFIREKCHLWFESVEVIIEGMRQKCYSVRQNCYPVRQYCHAFRQYCHAVRHNYYFKQQFYHAVRQNSYTVQRKFYVVLPSATVSFLCAAQLSPVRQNCYPVRQNIYAAQQNCDSVRQNFYAVWHNCYPMLHNCRAVRYDCYAVFRSETELLPYAKNLRCVRQNYHFVR